MLLFAVFVLTALSGTSANVTDTGLSGTSPNITGTELQTLASAWSEATGGQSSTPFPEMTHTNPGLLPTTPDPFVPTCSRMSCQGNCGRRFDRNDLYCSCHPDCRMFDRCCPDYETICNSVKLPESTLIPIDICGAKGCYSCTHHPSFHELAPFYSIAKCPKNYPEGLLKSRCDHPDTDKLSEVLPVVADDGLAYMNVYCAVCHNTPVHILTPLNTTVGCFQSDNDTDYFRQMPAEDITFSQVRSKMCEAKIERPPNVTISHAFCVKMDADSCPEGDPMAELCEAIYEPRVIDSMLGKPFFGRNKYCMACSSMRNNRWVRCWTQFVAGGTSGVHIGHFAFSVLFDISSLNTGSHSIASDTKTTSNSTDHVTNGLSFLSGTQETFFLHSTGSILPDYQGNVIENAIGLLEHSGLRLYNITINMESERQCPVWETVPGWATDFNISATMDSDSNDYADFISSSLSDLDDFHFSNMWLLSSIKVSNVKWPLETVCKSKVKTYSFTEFDTYCQARFYENQGNATTNNSCAIRFPLEVSWNQVGKRFPCNNATRQMDKQHQRNIHQLQPIQHSLDNAQFIVCGDSLETKCSLAVFTTQFVGSLLQEDQVSLWRKRLKTLLAIEDDVVACSEEIDVISGELGQHSTPTDIVQFILTAVGCTLSLLGLLLTFLTYLIFPDLRNLPGKCVMSLVMAMFAAQLSFVFGGLLAWRHPQVCSVLAVMQHFLWLASFAWTNVMAYDLATTFGSKSQPMLSPDDRSRKFKVYSAMGWLVPISVVAVSVCVHYTGAGGLSLGYGRGGVCWITDPLGLLIAFILPVSVNILINLCFFVVVVHGIYKVNKLTQNIQADKKNKRHTLVIYARISAVMGFTWLLGYLANAFPSPGIWYAFTVLNSSQGIYLFIAFVLNSKVLPRFVKKCRCGSNGKRHHSLTTASNQTASTTSNQTASTASNQTASTASNQTASTASNQTASTASNQTASTASNQTATTASNQTAPTASNQTASTASNQTASTASNQTASTAPNHKVTTTSNQTASETSNQSTTSDQIASTQSNKTISSMI